MLTQFLGVYYQSIGIDGVGIGIFSSLYAVFYILAGLIAGIAATAGINYRLILKISSLFGIFGTVFIFLGDICIFAIPIGLFLVACSLAIPSPIIDDLLISSLGTKHYLYSNYRKFGPLGFAIGSLISSNAIALIDVRCIFLLFSAGMISLLLLYNIIPYPVVNHPETKKNSNIRIYDFLGIIKIKGFALIFLSLAVWGICEQGMFQYLNLLIVERWDNISISGFVSSATMAGEFVAYGLISRILKAGIKASHLFGFGFILAAVQFIGIANANEPQMLIPLLFLGGAGFPFLWSSATALISEYIPHNLSAACREICSLMVSGVGAISGSLLYGFIYDFAGLEYAYQISFLIPLFGLLLSLLIGFIINAKHMAQNYLD